MTPYPKRAVAPLVPPAPYIGGKRNLAGRIIAKIERVPHRTYAEVFVGMAGVFLRRRYAAPVEVINDYNRDVSTLFRILQRHFPQFMDTLKFQLTTRAELERLVQAAPDTLTDLERAARFLYLQRTAFGGKVAGRNFGVSAQRPARFDVTRLGPLLEALHERLAAVTIECLAWQDFLERYDGPGVLFYLDPPYWGSEGDYGEALFSRDQFEALAARLARLKGRFILSLNDRPEVRRLFRSFALERVETSYSIAREHRQRAAELLITGKRR